MEKSIIIPHTPGGFVPPVFSIPPFLLSLSPPHSPTFTPRALLLIPLPTSQHPCRNNPSQADATTVLAQTYFLLLVAPPPAPGISPEPIASGFFVIYE